MCYNIVTMLLWHLAWNAFQRRCFRELYVKLPCKRLRGTSYKDSVGSPYPLLYMKVLPVCQREGITEEIQYSQWVLKWIPHEYQGPTIVVAM